MGADKKSCWPAGDSHSAGNKARMVKATRMDTSPDLEPPPSAAAIASIGMTANPFPPPVFLCLSMQGQEQGQSQEPPGWWLEDKQCGAIWWFT
mmetsp:Transcript_30008/g.50813  ORF Transcript_30008/g.50813 Transcript_30008/m.50813 type:complete len:93 (-) Transcript_30008:205-483(-)|eukprot:CAMPEP_0174314738 /NCGR_PEP_ID=MMETSP0810-20121108/5837_1 /TAXON_ID=73025 ORGANISM="Eutreptiella gymnastica-like, Strain CCMP1594" /NCGR_SAMPLE_ID=MMETSP0810 /ASSEMBLY_ACC=CAM_ASM_000659 /LENGTH=92 /DNA_ID=CAMNT_0015423925 /DNA_START=359 /DNA_END=637 /DNA_ORIENTATION=+